jgi:hypothetical protein
VGEKKRGMHLLLSGMWREARYKLRLLEEAKEGRGKKKEKKNKERAKENRELAGGGRIPEQYVTVAIAKTGRVA